MEKTKKLTTRQWELYKYLISNYDEDVYISKEKICEDLPKYYKIIKEETRVCRAIENDVRVINSSNIIQKIIVSNKFGYKIGSEKEVNDYIKKRFKRDLKSLKLDWFLARKVNMDGQMRIAFGKERDFIETFVSEEKKGE